MIASIWKDDELAFRGSIEISPIDTADLSMPRQWEGTLRVVGGEKFDVRSSYSLVLDDGSSAEIILTYLLGRNPLEVHFRVLAWNERPMASKGAPGK